MNSLIASALAGTKVQYFVTIAQNFMDDDLSFISIYLVDICDESCLSILADQLGVGGNDGFNYCKTVDQQRRLIKNAIILQAHMGTCYAIKKVCELLGFTYKRIDSGINGEWCRFNVILSGTQSDTTNLAYMINKYKSARDILNQIIFE